MQFKKQSALFCILRFFTRMDPDYSAQDVSQCDLCKTAIAQSCCDFCHVNLWKPCIGEHIFVDYGKHIIVPFQQRKSTLNYPNCGTHCNENCQNQCKDCNIIFLLQKSTKVMIS